MMDSQPGGAGMMEIIMDRKKDLWRLGDRRQEGESWKISG